MTVMVNLLKHLKIVLQLPHPSEYLNRILGTVVID
jgi:hypothetical protein